MLDQLNPDHFNPFRNNEWILLAKHLTQTSHEKVNFPLRQLIQLFCQQTVFTHVPKWVDLPTSRAAKAELETRNMYTTIKNLKPAKDFKKRLRNGFN